MKLSDNINKIDFSLLECQADVVLHALELYAYNLHFTFSKEDDYELLNSLIFYTYEGILSRYSSNQYRIGYDVSKNCTNEINRIRRKHYYSIRNYQKNIAC